MEYTYEYFIYGLDVYPNYKGYQNVVYRIVYSITGHCGNASNSNGATYDTINYEPTDTFVTYQNLTKDMVVNWLETNCSEKINQIKYLIKVELDKQNYSQTNYIDKPFGSQ